MSIIEALVLGVLQGLTEFLPVSSSGHLALAQHLLGMEGLERNIALTVVLHVASLAAVLIHYRRAIPALFSVRRRELAYLAVATLPIAVAGLTLRRPLEAAHALPLLVCACLVINGIFLLVADLLGRGDQPVAEARLWKIILVGVVQAVRLPGLSRSGGTIGTGWLCGIERKDAVRFSFLLSVPAILGVAAVKGRRLLDGGVDLPLLPVLLAASVTFVLSLVSIRVVERLSMRRGFLVFAIYGVVAGIAAGAWLLARP